MNDADRQAIRGYCTAKQLAAGTTLFENGEPGTTLYFIERGRLAVHKFTGFQNKMQVVALLDSGSVVGESSLVAAHKHKAKVTVIEDASLLCLERSSFQKMLNDTPELAVRLFEYVLGVMALRLEKTSSRLATIL